MASPFNYAGSRVPHWEDGRNTVPFNKLADLVLTVFCDAVETCLGFDWEEWAADDFPCHRIRSCRYPEREIHIFAPSAGHTTEVLVVVLIHGIFYHERVVEWKRFLWDPTSQREVDEFLRTYLGAPDAIREE